MLWTMRAALMLAVFDPSTSRAEESPESPFETTALLRLTGTLLDYAFPGNPVEPGRTYAGALVRAQLTFAHADVVSLEAGVVGRVPFALNFEREFAAAPHLALVVRLLGDERLVLRLGALDIRHGFHPALVDEAAYAIARDYERSYRRSLTVEAGRRIPGSPFLPVENGAQLLIRVGPFRADAFLDWQLLETAGHLEKFATGIVLSSAFDAFDVSAQLRLVHYGGQSYTEWDSVRREGLDPMRQPLSFALTARLRPLAALGLGTHPLRVDVPFAFVHGKMAQAAGGSPASHRGFEVGLETWLLHHVGVGYRVWHPRGGRAGFVSEDSEAVYFGPRAHRVSFLAHHRFEEAAGTDLNMRLDLVIPETTRTLQYLVVVTLTTEVDTVLGGARRESDPQGPEASDP